MKYNTLGNTGLFVSELCLGTMTFGGQGIWSNMGNVQQEEAQGLIARALDHGINFIDTADIYSGGVSEEILGQSLKNLGVRREARQTGGRRQPPHDLRLSACHDGSCLRRHRDHGAHRPAEGRERRTRSTRLAAAPSTCHERNHRREDGRSTRR